MSIRAVDAAEEGLVAAPPSALGFDLKAKAENKPPTKDEDGNDVYEGREHEIEEGVHKLETLLESNIDRNFDKFEIWALRNILCVPEDLAAWVKLGHYEV